MVSCNANLRMSWGARIRDRWTVLELSYGVAEVDRNRRHWRRGVELLRTRFLSFSLSTDLAMAPVGRRLVPAAAAFLFARSVDQASLEMDCDLRRHHCVDIPSGNRNSRVFARS